MSNCNCKECRFNCMGECILKQKPVNDNSSCPDFEER